MHGGCGRVVMSEAAVLVAVLLLIMIAVGTKVLFLPDDARLLIFYKLLGGIVL
mgnify:CR=1 FL=1